MLRRVAFSVVTIVGAFFFFWIALPMSAPATAMTPAMMARVIQNFLRDRLLGGFANMDCVMNFSSEMELTAESGEGCRVQENGAPGSAGRTAPSYGEQAEAGGPFQGRIAAPACPSLPRESGQAGPPILHWMRVSI